MTTRWAAGMPDYVKGYRPNGLRRRHEPLLDVAPEMMHYADTGCEVSDSCLCCPLPQCKYDDPAAYRAWKTRARDKAIAKARHTLTTSAVAVLFKISARTVARALIRSRRWQRD